MARDPSELPLTPRMWEVVTRIREGKSYGEIGAELSPPVTDKTVSNLSFRAAKRLPGTGDPRFKILTCSEKDLKNARDR